LGDKEPLKKLEKERWARRGVVPKRKKRKKKELGTSVIRGK